MGQFAEGCTSGIHLPGDDPVLVTDGDLTKFVTKCKRCGINMEISADLKLNKYLGEPTGLQSPQRLDMPVTTQTNTQSGDPENDPLVRELLGLK